MHGCITGPRWTQAEKDKLQAMAGAITRRSLRVAFPDRTYEAVLRMASRLGFTLHQGTWTLRRLMDETGYNQKQIFRARDELRQHWMRTDYKDRSHLVDGVRRGGTRYLISDEQALAIIDYLKDEHKRYKYTSRHGTPRLRWAKGYDCCQDCGTTKRPHYGKGCCQPCLKLRKRGVVNVAAVLRRLDAPLPWSVESDGVVIAANGKKVWDVPDANDDPEVAQIVVDTMNKELRNAS